MINETIVTLSNSSAPLVITTQATTNWAQFGISIVFASLGILFYLYLLLSMYSFGSLMQLRLKWATKRPTLVIKHNNAGLFSMEFIEQHTMNRVAKFLAKHPDKEVNLVLQTPGGTIFHSQAISELVLHHGKVHCYVPLMAMSGGTLVALSCYKLYMGCSAALGMVDPQIGSFFSGGSAADWKEVIKRKGSKSKDETFIYHREGKLYTKTIQDTIAGILRVHGARHPKEVSLMLTDGRLEHAHRFNFEHVARWRNNVYLIEDTHGARVVSLLTRSVIK